MPNARYGYVLTINEDGRVVWSSINNNNILPSQVGLSGYVLSTNGSAIQWAQQVAGSGGSSSLSGLSDVSLTIPSSGQFLSYDTSDNKWKNVPAPTGGGGVTTYIGATGVLVQGNQIRMGGTGVLNELIIQDSTSNSLIIQPSTGSTQDMQVWRANSLQSLAVGSDGHFKMGSEDFTQPKICFWDTNIADPDVWVAGISWYNNDIAFGETNHPYTKLYFYNNSAGDYTSWLEYSGGDTFYIYADGSLANLNLGSISTDGVSVGSQQVKFYENTGSGSNFFALKSPPSLSSDITLILPSGAGVNGQVLTSSGNNNMLYWSNASTPTSGTATALNTTAVSNNATFYPVLSSGTGSSAASIDLGLTYNPSTDMLTASGVTANRIVGNTNIIITESTTARTLQSGDNGGIIHCTNTSGATLTIPTGLPVGFSVGVLAAATGVVSFATSSTTLNNRQSHTKLAGQWAMGTIIQRTTNNFVLAGDTV